MAQDQLQTLKLEISKNATLLPFERIAMHKILGILKTGEGLRVLLKDLAHSPLVRESAVLVLKDFQHKEVQETFISLLSKETSDNENIYIFEHFEKNGTPEALPAIMDFIEKNKANHEKGQVLSKAFNALRAIGARTTEAKELLDYLKSISLRKESGENIRALAILSLSAFKEIVIPSQKDSKSFIEDILKEDSEQIICAAYNSLSMLNDTIMSRIQQGRTDEEELFTYSPEREDRAILDIRVIIGKMTSRFDTYSSNSKIALINAMISSNHRELLIYLMKALSPGNPKLTDMALDLLLANTHKLKDPDKLLRNLISLSIDSPRGNELIVEIFDNYFRNLKDTRRNMLFKDKLFNYLVVTLETYFETYRKDFMVTEVMEKNFPENFRRIRRFILDKFTPEQKKKLSYFLKSSESAMINNILAEIAGFIPYISEIEKEDFTSFLEILIERDIKSREISASRIEDINFEKRYLKDRIIRICSIIGRLKIDNGASPLVIIYNYVKKYTDRDILDSVSHTLSMLNYSYMLGELEVQLSTGDEAEQQKTVQYLSLFSDQRSLNIILDYLKQNPDKDQNIILMLLNSLLRQGLFANSNAAAILRDIIEKNPNIEIRRAAILCLGKCAREMDIGYLNSKFNSLKDNSSKEAIVQSIEHIMEYAIDINKRSVKNLMQEYIKDPGIKIRIYACYLLIKTGNKNALKSIMDMMTIKNKKIQRDIISVFAGLRSVDFAYFLISLLKDEYAISTDIVSMIAMLPPEELKEIDHFIINIFKKHEFIGSGENETLETGTKPHPVNGFSEGKHYILHIDIPDYLEKIKPLKIIEFKILDQQINELIISEIQNSNGLLTSVINGSILAYYKDPVLASRTALTIKNNFRALNNIRLPADRINLRIQLYNEKIKIINEEIINFEETKIRHFSSLPFFNKVILDESSKKLVERTFYSEPMPGLEFSECVISDYFFELTGPINFLDISEIILEKLAKEIDEKQKKEIQLETELKEKQKDKTKSSTTLTYAQALDDIGRLLKSDLNEINKYVQKRTTDRELIANVDKMLSNTYKRYFVEKSKLFSDLQ